jgi:hypothetical protein
VHLVEAARLEQRHLLETGRGVPGAADHDARRIAVSQVAGESQNGHRLQIKWRMCVKSDSGMLYTVRRRG